MRRQLFFMGYRQNIPLKASCRFIGTKEHDKFHPPLYSLTSREGKVTPPNSPYLRGGQVGLVFPLPFAGEGKGEGGGIFGTNTISCQNRIVESFKIFLTLTLSLRTV